MKPIIRFALAISLTAWLGMPMQHAAQAAPAVPAAAAADDSAQVDQVVVVRSWSVPDDLTIKARVTHIEPDEPLVMTWRYGGEGLGGDSKKQDFMPQGHVPMSAAALAKLPRRQVEEAKRPKHNVGQWSEPINLREIIPKRAPAVFFLTVTGGNPGKRDRNDPDQVSGQSKNVQFEFEVMQVGKTIKRLTALGTDGGTVGLVFPFELIPPDATIVPNEFIEGMCDLLTYAQRRNQMLTSLPWSNRPLPKKLMFMTDVNGHGEGMGYAIRHSDQHIVDTELANVRQLGVNGVRGASPYVHKRIEDPQSPFPEMRRIAGIHNMGYPTNIYRKDRKDNSPEAGCPYAAGVPERQQQNIAIVTEMLKRPYDEIWTLTVDEIGAVVDHTAEGKAHLSVCPLCIAAYRKYVEVQGRTPDEFGVASWDKLNPINVWDKKSDKAWLNSATESLNAYYSRLFINHSSAQLFTPLRDAVTKLNDAKQAAIDAGQNNDVARQPSLYTFALRGNTFLTRGHSLDFFDFYRLADNGFVHETSNRDPRVLGWDSYLLDVGRMITAEQKMVLGLYVKPHRGAPIQRALAGASRGAKMIFWYTYGPDYAKGDSFSEKTDPLALTSKAARLLGAAEDQLWLSRDVQPAQTAIIKPRASEVWLQFTEDNATIASWEDAKFTYTALTDSYVPVDPLDETMVLHNDLTQYRTIYMLGTNYPRITAKKLLAWVEAGGSLVLHAGAMSRDEANRPMSDIYAKLGLKTRNPVEMWKAIKPYGSVQLQSLNDNRAVLAPVPPEANVRFVSGPLAGKEALPVVGREVLEPLPGTTVLARYGDGVAAVVEHTLGRGKIVLLGTFAGLEYTAPQRDIAYDMRRDLQPLWREASAGVAAKLADRPVWSDLSGLEIRRITNPQGKQSLAVMNWAYHITGSTIRQVDGRSRSGYLNKIIEEKDVKIHLPNAKGITTVRSAWLQKTLPVERNDDGSITITLPELEEADVLILE